MWGTNYSLKGGCFAGHPPGRIFDSTLAGVCCFPLSQDPVCSSRVVFRIFMFYIKARVHCDKITYSLCRSQRDLYDGHNVHLPPPSNKKQKATNKTSNKQTTHKNKNKNKNKNNNNNHNHNHNNHNHSLIRQPTKFFEAGNKPTE